MGEFYGKAFPHGAPPEIFRREAALEQVLSQKLAKRPITALEIDAAIKGFEKRWRNALMQVRQGAQS